MARILPFPTFLLAALIIGFATVACGDDDAPGAADGTPTLAASETAADATLFVPDPADPCPHPGGQAISGLVALLEFGNEGLDEGGSVQLREPVQMTLRIINCSEGKLERKYAGAQEFDFFVRTVGGDTVWRWSDGQDFGTDGSTVTFDPGQELTYETTWSQVDSDGQVVAPGEYDVVAESLACDTSLSNCSTRAAATITISR